MYSFKTKLIRAGRNSGGKNTFGKFRYQIYLNVEAIKKLNAKPQMPVKVTIEPIIEKNEPNIEKENKKEDDSERTYPQTDSSPETRQGLEYHKETKQLS